MLSVASADCFTSLHLLEKKRFTFRNFLFFLGLLSSICICRHFLWSQRSLKYRNAMSSTPDKPAAKIYTHVVTCWTKPLYIPWITSLTQGWYESLPVNVRGQWPSPVCHHRHTAYADVKLAARSIRQTSSKQNNTARHNVDRSLSRHTRLVIQDPSCRWVVHKWLVGVDGSVNPWGSWIRKKSKVTDLTNHLCIIKKTPTVS